jgi:tetratricopeptide (TPR) repeat protein
VLTRVLLLALLGVAGGLTGLYLWAGSHFGAVQRALAERDYAEAKRHALLCLRVWPGDPETHFLAARACRSLGAYDEAERHLKACRHGDTLGEAVELEAALLQTQRGDLARKEGFLLSCVEQEHPDSPLILEVLVKGYVQTHQLARAMDCADRWVRSQPHDAEALFWRGRVRELLYAHQPAMEDYRRALALDPQHDRARLRLAEHLVQSGQVEEALEHYEHLAQEQPANDVVQLGLAHCYNELRQPDKARPLLYLLLAAHSNDSAILLEAGKNALLTDRPTEAEDYFRKAVQIAPYERMANYLLAVCLQQRGQSEEARGYLRQMERIHRDVQRLRELTRQAGNKQPDAAARYELGTLLLRNGHEEEGRAWLEGLLRIDPQNGPARAALTEYYQHKGDRALAARYR